MTTLTSISARDAAKDMLEVALHAYTTPVNSLYWTSYSSPSTKEAHVPTNADAIPYSADLTNGAPLHTWTSCGNGWSWPTTGTYLSIAPDEIPGAGLNPGLLASLDSPVHSMFSVVSPWWALLLCASGFKEELCPG